MVNVQVATEFFFRDAAILTGVLVTMAGIAALLSPVGAVVRVIATAPVMGLFAAKRTLPNRHTGFGAEAAAGCARLLDFKSFVAGGAFLLNALSAVRPWSNYFWSRLARLSEFQIVTMTAVGTKVVFSILDRSWPALEGFTAHFAMEIQRVYTMIKSSEIVDRCKSSASLRTILARPTAVIPKCLAAMWAVGIDAGGGALAGPRTVNLNAA